MTSPLLKPLRAALKQHADPARAQQMQAYMKSETPSHGVPVPQVRLIAKEQFEPLKFETPEAWRDAVLALWHAAEFREERLAAIFLTGVKAARSFQTMDALPMYEELIVTGAWWDYVDDIATHRLSVILTKHPAEMKKAMRAWSRSKDLWKRRSAIICQIPLKKKTDFEFLTACIEPAIESKEFFLRKAIGWALREYSKTAPDEVSQYVHENENRLSPLSKREALRLMLAADDEAA
jgi:3-methyladenine DNA glycosylase AlkD